MPSPSTFVNNQTPKLGVMPNLTPNPSFLTTIHDQIYSQSRQHRRYWIETTMPGGAEGAPYLNLPILHNHDCRLLDTPHTDLCLHLHVLHIDHHDLDLCIITSETQIPIRHHRRHPSTRELLRYRLEINHNPNYASCRQLEIMNLLYQHPMP